MKYTSLARVRVNGLRALVIVLTPTWPWEHRCQVRRVVYPRPAMLKLAGEATPHGEASFDTNLEETASSKPSSSKCNGHRS